MLSRDITYVTDYATLLLNLFVIVILHVIILEIYTGCIKKSNRTLARSFHIRKNQAFSY